METSRIPETENRMPQGRVQARELGRMRASATRIPHFVVRTGDSYALVQIVEPDMALTDIVNLNGTFYDNVQANRPKGA
jgi:hypothetical protein